jgi:hypothetical protein
MIKLRVCAINEETDTPFVSDALINDKMIKFIVPFFEESEKDEPAGSEIFFDDDSNIRVVESVGRIAEIISENTNPFGL